MKNAVKELQKFEKTVFSEGINSVNGGINPTGCTVDTTHDKSLTFPTSDTADVLDRI